MSHQSSRMAWAILGLLIAILAVILALSPLFINVDSGMYLEVGRYLLDGRIPYVDYVELNPPLIHYINVIPVAIAQLLTINPIIVYKAMVILVMLYAGMVSRRLSRSEQLSKSVPIMLLIPIVIVFEAIADYADFGQRDHLIGLVLVPWLLLRTERYVSPETKHSLLLTLSIGFFAAIAMALRPYFVVPLALVELYFLARYRTIKHIFRSETVIVILTGVLYLAHFALLPEASRDMFFNTLIPFVQNNYESYSLYSGDDFWLLMNARFIHLIFMFVGSFALFLALPKDYRPPILLPFFIFSAGAYAVYLYQKQGFSYHVIPATIIVFLIFGILLQAYRQALRDDVPFSIPTRIIRLLVITFAISGGLLVLMLGVVLPALNILPSDTHLVEIIETHTQPEDPVFIVDSAMTPAFPMLTRINRQLDMTYVQAFPIALSLYGQPDLTVYDGDAELPESLQLYVDALARDIQVYQPELIFINSGACYGCPDDFEIYAWLQSRHFIDDNFVDYSVLTEDSVDGFVIYERDN